MLISAEQGEAVAYALFNLQERGRMFVAPGEPRLRGHDHRHPQPRQRSRRQPDQGQEAHQHPRRRQGRERRSSPRRSSSRWKTAIEFIDDDELVEVTPKSIRLRKRHLLEHERKRAAREEATA